MSQEITEILLPSTAVPAALPTISPTDRDARATAVTLPQATHPEPVPPNASLDHPSLYLNRELGWIDFNWRVLALAKNEDVPLLERVRFVAITASNLDEFTQKRIGGLKRQEAAGVTQLSHDGRTPTEQLVLLREAVALMYATMTSTWENELRPLLNEQNIIVCDYEDLTPQQRARLHAYFRREIYPILTPLSVDPGHPFPFISNLSLSLAITVKDGRRKRRRFVRLKVPSPRWIPVPDEDGNPSDAVLRFLPAEQLIARHVDEVVGTSVEHVHAFRVTRNADIRRDEEEAEELLDMISEELRQRRFAPVVRLEVDKNMPESQRRILRHEIGLDHDDLVEVDGMLDLTACFALADLDFPMLRYAPWEAVVPLRVAQDSSRTSSRDMFAAIRDGDLLVHHPYDSFAATTQRLIEDAADDERVIAIKQALYRTSDHSPIIDALIRAGEKGKQVAVLVEVKARFDEANNIEWGQMLENSGVHVAYGLVGLKTHTKATLIVRRDPDGLRTYCHVGTGNYNSKTAKLYTDLGLLTCSPVLGRDLVNLFHFLTAYAESQQYERALVAPHYMRRQFYALIDAEIQAHALHGNGRIIAKMNALDDPGIIRKLYEASQVGVGIDLIVRGHCSLRPGLPRYSDNIRVISILGRFLEHDRIYYFHNNGCPHLLIGSADWRTRNLNSRVELVIPIEESALQARLMQILEAALSDNQLAWEMDRNGRFHKRVPAPGERLHNFHEDLMQQAIARVV